MISGTDDDKNRQWYYKEANKEHVSRDQQLASEDWQPFSKAENKIINTSCDTGTALWLAGVCHVTRILFCDWLVCVT